jgi:alcohol dehydrogenase (cytochrome c)
VEACVGDKGGFISAAPVIFDGKLYVGEAGADTGSSGHIHAFDAVTGKHVWTFDTIATGNQPGAHTWLKGSVPAGGSTWTTITVEPSTRRLYVPVGNPYPDLDLSVRQGDNLYTNAIVVLNADTGKPIWHVQQVKADFHDWDTAAAPVIYDIGKRKFMAVGSKDARLYFYGSDRKKLFARKDIGIRENDTTPLTSVFTRVCPGYLGGVEWSGPAFDPNSRSVFVNSVA